MATVLLALYTLLCVAEQTLAVPDYRNLHENLSRKKQTANDNSKMVGRDGTPVVAEIGKYFKFSLDDYIIKGDDKNKLTVSFTLFYSVIAICSSTILVVYSVSLSFLASSFLSYIRLAGFMCTWAIVIQSL